MIAFFYDLLFLLPFSAAVTLLLRPYWWADHERIPALAVCLAAAVLMLCLKHSVPGGGSGWPALLLR